MVRMGFARQEIYESVTQRRYDHTFATYLLLRENGGLPPISPVRPIVFAPNLPLPAPPSAASSLSTNHSGQVAPGNVNANASQFPAAHSNRNTPGVPPSTLATLLSALRFGYLYLPLFAASSATLFRS